ncbi:MAG TPA: type IX secretion system membrane protein PorP/SprF, partial [Chitinophagaceae bacterium]|nr:type IX secretion system membrane protein PorP/SprF [Chitinophagaceae bacterium]
LSTAYHKGLDENGYNQLGAGFQATYVSKLLNVSSLKFGDQLRSDGFTGLTQESFSKDQLSLAYFDVNAGVFYNGTSDGANNYYAGVSVYHVNRHKETFQEGDYFLAPRVTFQAGGKIPMGLNALHLSANHSRQAGAVNTIIGGAYSLNVNNAESNATNLYIGSWFRLGDAIIPYIGLEFGELHIGATYDVNVSKLKPASNMRGGAEFSLIYIRQPRDPNAKRLNCPKF